MRDDTRHRIAYYAIAAFAVVAGWAMAGCAHNPASKARQVVSAVDTGTQVAAVGQLACTQVARTQADQHAMDKANDTYRACERLNASMHVAVDATSATLKGIKAAEDKGAKDYGGILAPIYSAACDLQDAIRRVAEKINKPIPVSLPCPEVK